MTCIIGVAEEGKIYIGSDSAGSDSYTSRAMKTPKVFRLGDFMIGYTSSFRMGQILRYKLLIPERMEGETDEHYVQSSFVDAVRECLRNHGYTRIENNTETGGQFVVGYKGMVCTVQSDFAILCHEDGLEIVGAGEYIALGVMAALEALPPVMRITKALEITHRFQPNAVLPPFNVLEG